MKGENEYYTYDTETGEVVPKCDDILLIKISDVLEKMKKNPVVKIGWMNFGFTPKGSWNWYADYNYSTKDRKAIIIGFGKSLNERYKLSIKRGLDEYTVISQKGFRV